MGWLSSIVGGVVGFLVGGPVGAIIGAGIGATKVGERIVDSVLDFVLQPFMGPMDIGGSSAEREQGVTFQREGSVQQIPVVYGYRKVGGVVAFAETGASKNKYLHVAYVFSEGVVEGLREVYIDDWLLPVDQVGALNGGNLVTVNADKYKDRVQLRWYPGVYFQNPKDSPVGQTVLDGIFSEASSFTNKMNFNGLAVMFARYEWRDIVSPEDAENNPFTGNIPELQISVLGKRVASLLVDTTETVAYDFNQVRYSTNPAEILLDYLRNPRYGKGLNNDDIDWAAFKTAARKCNQTVTYVASGIKGPILTLNMVVDTSSTLMNNVKMMLQNFRGYMPYVQGKYKLGIEDAGHPTDILSGSAVISQTFNKDNIVSDITFNGIEKSAKYNVVAVSYVDPDQKFSVQQVVFPETEDERQVFINRDGGRENKQEVTLGGITNYAIAKDMARLLFNKSRQQDSCFFTATSQALELEPGDNIRIQSNILDFGEDPWRVISVKINSDMTVGLGCVRNPDNIYPYVRVGEEDIVLPPYIPKGSIIYFPSSDNNVPLGLVPPLYAVFPVVIPPVEEQVTNPVPSDPQAPEYEAPGPIAVEPETPATEPPSEENTPPVAPPPPPAFDSTLTYKRVNVQKLPNGNYRWSVIFTQPADSLYSYTLFWWRFNRFSSWQEVRVEAKPGAGGEIPVSLGELPKGTYNFYARSYASDGRASTKLLQGQAYLTEDQSATTGGIFVGVGGANTISASGFTLPGADIAPVAAYDADIEWMYLFPVLTGGLPQSTRRIRYKFQQIQDAINAPYNNLINGFKIYYRLKGDTYWSYETVEFSGSYAPGQIVEGELAGDFGARNYPTPPETWLFTGVNEFQKYEFLVRLTYADGKPALKQLGPATGLVEYFAQGAIGGNGYNFVVWGRKVSSLDGTGIAVASSGTVNNNLITAAFNTQFQTVDQAPPGVVAGLDTVPSIISVASSGSRNTLLFRFNFPSTNKFRGFKIRWRPIVPGSDPDYYEVVTGTIPNTSNQIVYTLSDNNYVYNRDYDMTITAQIFNPIAGAIVDATNSLVSRHNIANNDPEYTNLTSKMNFSTKSSASALQLLLDEFPALPIVNAKSWNKIVPNAWDTNGSGEILWINSTNQRLNHYYQLTFQLPSTATGIVCYRRVYDTRGLSITPATNGKARYTGIGPWERVYWNKATDLVAVDGWYTINVRGPVDPAKWFDSQFGVSTYPTATLRNTRSPVFDPFFPNSNSPNKISDVRPYYGAGNEALSAFAYAQYLFVVETSAGVEGSKGLLLRSFQTENGRSSGEYKRIREGFGEGNVSGKLVEDMVAEFDTPFESGYERKKSDYLNSVSLDKMHSLSNWARVPGNIVFGYIYYDGSTPFTVFLQGPTDGAEVR